MCAVKSWMTPSTYIFRKKPHPVPLPRISLKVRSVAGPRVIVCRKLTDPAAVSPDIHPYDVGVSEGSASHSGAPRRETHSSSSGWEFSPYRRPPPSMLSQVREGAELVRSLADASLVGTPASAESILAVGAG